jgi:hypothetical protein
VDTHPTGSIVSVLKLPLYLLTVPRSRCGVPPGALLSKGGLNDSSLGALDPVTRDYLILLATPFFDGNLHSLSDHQNIIQGPPKPTQMTPKTIPQTKKTRNSQNMTYHQNHYIYYSLGTSSPHLSTTWPSKKHADADTPTYLQIS